MKRLSIAHWIENTGVKYKKRRQNRRFFLEKENHRSNLTCDHGNQSHQHNLFLGV